MYFSKHLDSRKRSYFHIRRLLLLCGAFIFEEESKRYNSCIIFREVVSSLSRVLVFSGKRRLLLTLKSGLLSRLNGSEGEM